MLQILSVIKNEVDLTSSKKDNCPRAQMDAFLYAWVPKISECQDEILYVKIFLKNCGIDYVIVRVPLLKQLDENVERFDLLVLKFIYLQDCTVMYHGD